MPVLAPPPTRPVRRTVRPSSTDAELVAQMRAGDESAYEAIFHRHHQPLLSYCRHMLGSLDEAEDALQQAFIRAHRALVAGDPPRELRRWLYAIARNCCRTALAARRPQAQLHGEEPGLDGLADEVARREDLRELVADLNRLPEEQRSALLLAELEDLRHDEIADILGCPVTKVKALVYQARSALLAERTAREAACREIREELAVARGGALRRGPLRRHLRMCPGCREFQQAVVGQRDSLAIVLPVAASAGLGAKVVAHLAAAHAASVSAGVTLCAPAAASAALGTADWGGAAGTGAGAAASTAASTAATAGSAATASTAVGAAGASTAATAGTAAAASTLASAGTAATASTAAATATGATLAGAAAGATTTGAALGGGILAKLAIGGAVASVATAGAIALPHRHQPAKAASGQHPARLARATQHHRPGAAQRIAGGTAAIPAGRRAARAAAAAGPGGRPRHGKRKHAAKAAPAIAGRRVSGSTLTHRHRRDQGSTGSAAVPSAGGVPGAKLVADEQPHRGPAGLAVPGVRRNAKPPAGAVRTRKTPAGPAVSGFKARRRVRAPANSPAPRRRAPGPGRAVPRRVRRHR